jgi:hypothetical protein
LQFLRSQHSFPEALHHTAKKCSGQKASNSADPERNPTVSHRQQGRNCAEEAAATESVERFQK